MRHALVGALTPRGAVHLCVFVLFLWHSFGENMVRKKRKTLKLCYIDGICVLWGAVALCSSYPIPFPLRAEPGHLLPCRLPAASRSCCPVLPMGTSKAVLSHGATAELCGNAFFLPEIAKAAFSSNDACWNRSD